MATVSHRRSRRYSTYQPQREANYLPPRKGKWLKRLVIGSTLLLVLVLVAPMIIANTPLRDAPLRLAMQSLHGTVHAGGASLSWFAPISYSDIEIRAANGELLLAVPKISSERSLFDIITHLSDLGSFRIERPQVSLVLRRDGSNLEDVISSPANSLQQPPEPAAETGSSQPVKLPTLSLEIVDGSINISDTSTKQRWQVDKFNFLVRTSSECPLPVEVKMSAEVPYSGKKSQISITSTPASNGVDQIDAQIDTLPLAMFRAVADRALPGVQVDGTLSTNLRCDGISQYPKSPLRVTGQMTVDSASLLGGPLGNDRFALKHVELPCKLTYQDRRLDVEQLALNCDVGKISATGNIAISDQSDVNTLGRLAQSTFNVEGQLDLVKLAALLPKTLHVRDGTQITGGEVRLTLSGKPDGATQALEGRLIAGGLAAMHDGRRITWDQPIDLQVAVREQAGRFWLDQFTGKASFMMLTVRGSLDQFEAQMQCDLDRLMGELNQFVDLGQLRLAGRGDSRLTWQHTDQGAFETTADARLQGLTIALPGRQPWQDDSVLLSASASGIVDNFGLGAAGSPSLRRLNAAQLTATVDNTAARSHEQVAVRLLQPIDQITSSTHLPLEAKVQGQLGHWWPRIAAWLNLDGLDLGGACDIAVQATYSGSGVEIQQVKGNINGLHAWGWNSVFIDEPVVQMECSGGYDFASSRLTLNRTQLLTSTVSLQTESATITLPGKNPFGLTGLISYQADLNRLSRWISDPGTPPKYALAGRLIGTADVARNGSATRGKVNATADDFAVYAFDSASSQRPAVRTAAAQSQQPVWVEKKLTMALDGNWDQMSDSLQLASLQIGSQALALQAAGKVDSLGTRQYVDLSGTIDYDWQSLGPLLKPYLGSKVAITGRESRKFAVHGPLGNVATQTAATQNSSQSSADSFASLRPLVADVSLGWTTANLYGMQIGPLDLITHLENGTVTAKPIQTTIGDPRSPGKLTLTPAVRLSPNPSELVLGPGPVLTNVQFTQQLNSSWMRFVAPILAESAKAEGNFSLELDSGRVPLEDPNRAELSGRLIINRVSVTPGPLLRPLVLISQQIEAIVKRRPPPLDMSGNPVLVQINNQKVDFRMVDGRIYHQGLQMQIGDTIVRTRGWVGVDETLGLVAEVPLKPDWIQGNSRLASVADQTLRIPITGTLSKPKIDARVVEQLIGAAMINVSGKIESELTNGLQRLIPPPPQR